MEKAEELELFWGPHTHSGPSYVRSVVFLPNFSNHRNKKLFDTSPFWGAPPTPLGGEVGFSGSETNRLSVHCACESQLHCRLRHICAVSSNTYLQRDLIKIRRVSSSPKSFEVGMEPLPTLDIAYHN